MLYFSLALVICCGLLVWKQPDITINFNQHKKIEVLQIPVTPTPALTQEELEKLREDAPPSIDDFAQAISATLFELGGADE